MDPIDVLRCFEIMFAVCRMDWHGSLLAVAALQQACVVIPRAWACAVIPRVLRQQKRLMVLSKGLLLATSSLIDVDVQQRAHKGQCFCFQKYIKHVLGTLIQKIFC